MADDCDQVLRAITNDGSFRVITARTTDTVRGVLKAQAPHGPLARRLAEVVTGAILVRETMAPEFRLQVILQAPNKGSLVADSHPGGLTRGLCSGVGSDSPVLGPGALLQVVRTLPRGKMQQGVVEAPAGGGVSGALMSYMQQSEQVTTFLAVSCLFDGDSDDLLVAGGYMVQVLPEVGAGPLALMTARLEGFKELDQTLETTAGDAQGILDEVLYGIEHTTVQTDTCHFGCTCDEVRVVSALASIGQQEIKEIVDAGKTIEMNCDYCGTEYKISPARLRGLLTGS